MTRSPSQNQAFVRVSRKDRRYFELSDGRPWVPIGLNLIRPPRDGSGLAGMESWLDHLSACGGNYIRLWLSDPFFDVEHQVSGRYDPAKADRIAAVLDLARARGIRVKMCIEHFRHFGDGPAWSGKRLHHRSQGGPFDRLAEFFDTAVGRRQFLAKLDWLAESFGSDPAIFGWELWNEIDAVAEGDYLAWTEAMLPELQRRFPDNLCMQSLGSFDRAKMADEYRRLAGMEGNDVLQVHRYLDLGAELEVCHGPVDALAADAVAQMRSYSSDRPVLLAESGAVEPSHTGPFACYAADREGMILHDVLFAPFLAGAAGAGMIWHWDVYVARNDLWFHFQRFARAIEGIDPREEGFETAAWDDGPLRVRALVGRRTVLLWCRDAENTWRSELAEGQPPRQRTDPSLDLRQLPGPTQFDRASAYDPWTDRQQDLPLEGMNVPLPPWRRSLVVRLLRRIT